MLIASFDDGTVSDVKSSELMSKYGIKTIFYIPVLWQEYNASMGRRSISLQELREIAKVHEIGSHTISHHHLTKLPLYRAKAEIRDSKEILEDLLGVEVKSFCPPRGYTNEELTEYTLSIYDNQRLTRGDNLVHIHPDSGANENRPWRSLVNKDSHIWGHSYEIDKFNLWDELEGVCGSYS